MMNRAMCATAVCQTTGRMSVNIENSLDGYSVQWDFLANYSVNLQL